MLNADKGLRTFINKYLMYTILAIFWMVAGIVLIIWGADKLTDGASSLARRMGMSDLIVGLTVVAFGTSAPELAISLISALKDSSELAIGNVVGSNIFNVLVIVGATALISPIKVGKSLMLNEIPLVVLSALALLAIGLEPGVNRTDGILLLCFFAVFMRYVISQAHTQTPSSEPSVGAAEKAKAEEMPLWKACLWILLGLGCLVFGGDRFVSGASDIARILGVSEAIIGLTIVSVGTSLPELATSIVSARKGHSDMAIGNVIGSNIFNIFMVLGLSATITPLPFGGITQVDLWVLFATCCLFWLCSRSIGNSIITRGEGAFMLLCYIGYTVYLILQV